MLSRRLIVCLDVAAGQVVKGVQFVSLKEMGNPAESRAATSRMAPMRSSFSTSPQLSMEQSSFATR